MTRRRGIPHCRDWRVRYVNADGVVTHEMITVAPTKFFALCNARDNFGWQARHDAAKVTCWPMPAAKPPSINRYL